MELFFSPPSPLQRQVRRIRGTPLKWLKKPSEKKTRAPFFSLRALLNPLIRGLLPLLWAFYCLSLLTSKHTGVGGRGRGPPRGGGGPGGGGGGGGRFGGGVPTSKGRGLPMNTFGEKGNHPFVVAVRKLFARGIPLRGNLGGGPRKVLCLRHTQLRRLLTGFIFRISAWPCTGLGRPHALAVRVVGRLEASCR